MASDTLLIIDSALFGAIDYRNQWWFNFIWITGYNFSQIVIKLRRFSLKEIHLKTSFSKCRPLCSALNMFGFDRSANIACLRLAGMDMASAIYLHSNITRWINHPENDRHSRDEKHSLIAWFIRANMGPIWGRQDPSGPHAASHNDAIVWKRIQHYWAFVRGTAEPPMHSP